MYMNIYISYILIYFHMQSKPYYMYGLHIFTNIQKFYSMNIQLNTLGERKNTLIHCCYHPGLKGTLTAHQQLHLPIYLFSVKTPFSKTNHCCVNYGDYFLAVLQSFLLMCPPQNTGLST